MRDREYYIAMPTRGRVDKQYTLSNLRPELRALVNVYCHPGELQQFQKYRSQVASIQEYGKNCSDIGKIREYIINHSNARNVIFLDDNLSFFSTKIPPTTRLTGWTFGMTEKNYTPSQILKMQTEMFQWMMDRLKTYAMCGFSFNPFNRNGRGDKINCRIFGIWGINVEKYLSTPIRFCDWPVKEDFAVSIQLIKSGYDIVCNYDYAFDKACGANAKGGCSGYRTLEVSNRYSEKLRSLFPSCVTVVEKLKNWGGELNKKILKETIINWKKIR